MGHEPMMVLDPNFNFEYIKSTLPPMGLMPVKDESFLKLPQWISQIKLF